MAADQPYDQEIEGHEQHELEPCDRMFTASSVIPRLSYSWLNGKCAPKSGFVGLFIRPVVGCSSVLKRLRQL